MDIRKSNKRSRSATINDDGYWDCSFCTYRNKSEAFKCEICNIRKGTSTRKPRITQVTQQFVKIENQIEQERKKERRKEILLKSRANKKNSLNSNNHNRFANAQTIAITVNDVTVFITDIELNIENENEFLNITNNNNNNTTELSNNKTVANKKTNKMNSNLETSNQDLNNTDDNTTSSNLDETDLNKNDDSNTSNNNNNHHNNSASNNLLLNNNKTEAVRVDARSN